MFGQRGGSDAIGRRAVKNIGIRTDIGQTFAETGTTSPHLAACSRGWAPGGPASPAWRAARSVAASAGA